MLLTPTLATETPRLGHLDPTPDYDTIMERLLDWVAFTPLQNATGDPAISLPLATTAARPAAGHDVLRRCGREATLLELAYELEEASRSRGSPARDDDTEVHPRPRRVACCARTAGARRRTPRRTCCRSCGPGMSLLDVGCGPGHHHRRPRRAGRARAR